MTESASHATLQAVHTPNHMSNLSRNSVGMRMLGYTSGALQQVCLGVGGRVATAYPVPGDKRGPLSDIRLSLNTLGVTIG